MAYTALEAAALAQIEKSVQAFHRHRLAAESARQHEALMEWRDHEGVPHLYKCYPCGKLQCIGSQSAKLIQVHDDYRDRRLAVEIELTQSHQDLKRCENLNRSTQANRVPQVVIGVLNALGAAGLGDYYRVIGTHSLYAYELAAGVTFDPATTATNDVDLLWNVNQRIVIAARMQQAGLSMVQLLQGVDPTFERVEEQKESAANSTGFFVDFLRQEEAENVPYSISDTEGDVYPVPAERAQRFLNSPHFEQVVVGLNGSMTRMRTVDPAIFVEFKLWMANLPTREFIKRGRDRRQAEAVQQLLDHGLLRSSALR